MVQDQGAFRPAILENARVPILQTFSAPKRAGFMSPTCGSQWVLNHRPELAGTCAWIWVGAALRGGYLLLFVHRHHGRCSAGSVERRERAGQPLGVCRATVLTGDDAVPWKREPTGCGAAAHAARTDVLSAPVCRHQVLHGEVHRDYDLGEIGAGAHDARTGCPLNPLRNCGLLPDRRSPSKFNGGPRPRGHREA